MGALDSARPVVLLALALGATGPRALAGAGGSGVGSARQVLSNSPAGGKNEGWEGGTMEAADADADADADAEALSVHTAFCAECTHAFDWKSIGVFHSHRASGMPGPCTRLMACSAHQLQGYKGLHIGRTFVHPNYGTGDIPGYDMSLTYNKPASLTHFLRDGNVTEAYVLYIDADMLLRKPMLPRLLGARRGVVVSERVRYLSTGINAGLPQQFVSEEASRKSAPAGWYHLFHADDARAIAPRWLHFCREVRQHPEKYWAMPGKSNITRNIPTGDTYVQFGQAPWISEMYGYVIAAAERGVDHILTEGEVVYADDAQVASRPREASLVHYGLHCYVDKPKAPGADAAAAASPARSPKARGGPATAEEGRRGKEFPDKYHFTKYNYNHAGFSPLRCDGQLIEPPPRPREDQSLCAETVETLNDGLCAFYRAHCNLTVECPAHVHESPTPPPCEDTYDKPEHCTGWTQRGECGKNRAFMFSKCRKSCGACGVASFHTGGAAAARQRAAAALAEKAASPRPIALTGARAGALRAVRTSPAQAVAGAGAVAAGHRRPDPIDAHERFAAVHARAASARPSPSGPGSAARVGGRARERIAELADDYGAMLMLMWVALAALGGACACYSVTRLSGKKRGSRRRTPGR